MSRLFRIFARTMDTEVENYNIGRQDFKRNLAKLMASESYAQIAPLLFPELSKDELERLFLGFENVGQFQSVAMKRACEYIIQSSTKGFSWSGKENISDRPTLYISNHRDIILDSMLLQYILVSEGHETTNIVIGTNLYEMPMLTILASLNKMIGIGRGGNKRQYYDSLMVLSQQLRHIVAERNESVWIAQRNGRTKDGIDRTEPALVKMISYSGDRKNPVESLAEMNIVPISISYEWEPCAWMKAREMALREQGPYTKEAGEDTRSIISGITGQKGRVHLSICKPLGREELEAMNGDFHKVAQLIDQRIAEAYRLWPNNLIARHMLDADCPKAPATDEEQKAFADHVDQACKEMGMGGEFRSWLLRIYAGNMGDTTQQEQ